MYKVDKAIIMAAGLGSRLRPITLTTPKPLIKVNGKAMIETVIEALEFNNINQIYIVVGYLKEQFKYLETRYSNVHLIDNPYYNSCNNISSLYMARDYLENAIILDGDQVIFNKAIVQPLFERSGYNCVWTENYTNEWLLTTKNEIVTNCSRTGGKNGWQLFSISRWNEEDGKKLKKHLEIEFNYKKNTQIYWDDVPLFCYPKEYELGIFKMKYGDVLEIDSYDELVKIDTNYLKNGGGKKIGE